MKKILSLALCLVLLAALFAGCGEDGSSSSAANTDASASAVSENSTNTNAGNRELNLYTWEGVFPQEVLSDFTEQTGIKINYINFDYDETMLAKLETANGGDYDVIIADDYIIETAIEEGLVQKLDKSKLSHYDSINPLYQGQFFDPDDEYTVPYGAGVQTIVYNPENVNIDITGYADLWDESLRDEVGIIANYRVVNGMALKVLGESYNTDDTALIEQAGEKLLELAPNIRLIKDDNIQDDLISGEISAAVMYSNQVTTAKLANPDLKVVYPKEGLGFGIMANFIPVNAPHPDEAYEFINYILDPEVSAKCFEYFLYYCTNQDADSLIREDYQEFLTLPESFTSEDMEMIQNVAADAMEAHEKVWTQFKSACGQ